MGDKTKIEWCDTTWNPLRGCSKVSAGCANCYAEKVAARFSQPPIGRAGSEPDSLDRKAGPYFGVVEHGSWNGKTVLVEEHLTDPLRWTKPRRIFVNSMSDLFHESVPDEWIDRIFAVMAFSPRHTFQVLTKRPERMLAYLRMVQDDDRDMERWNLASWDIERRTEVEWPDWPLPNVWLGVSIEDQATADERIPLLLETPAAVRFVSAEPLLGSVDLRDFITKRRRNHISASVEGILRNKSFIGICDDDGNEMSPAEAEAELLSLRSQGVRLLAASGCDRFDPEKGCLGHELPRLDWVIAGGESGPKARPMHPDWASSLRDQCQAAGVAFHFKQWGEWLPFGLGYMGAKWLKENRLGARSLASIKTDGVTYSGNRVACDPDDEVIYARVGKKVAGRQLDGRTWDEMPESRS